ncbi:MAG: DUF5069 domain-containing protein [Vulcanimicrobiaceae bacterium]
MSTQTGQKITPIVSSSTAGPLGAVHLPRLWAKLTLGNAGVLADGYDFCGAGFDQMTIDNLNLKKDRVLAYVRDNKPTYSQFEQWVAAENGGSIAPDVIKRHNASIHGYNHSDELGAKMRASSGIRDAGVKDAVTLNTLEDLDELHSTVTKH